MPEHVPPGGLPTRREHGHGNRWHIKSDSRPDSNPPIVRQVDALSVPYGEQITRRGGKVWAAYTADGELIGAAATANEATRMWRKHDVQKRIAEQADKQSRKS